MKNTLSGVLFFLFVLGKCSFGDNFFKYILTTGETSPFEINWKKEPILLVTTGVGNYFSAKYWEYVPILDSNYIASLNKSVLNSLDQHAWWNGSETASKISNSLNMVLGISTGLYLIPGKTRRDMFCIALMFGESYLLASGITNFGKGFFKRPRPSVYNKEKRRSNLISSADQHSFPSGHSTGAFTFSVFCSMVFQSYYPDSKMVPWVWGGLNGIAVGATVARYYSGAHFPTDLIAGALIGSFSGWLIPRIHLKKDTNNRVAFFPLVGNNTGLGMRVRL